MRALAKRCLETYEATVGKPFPQDPRAQLLAAVGAVFDSWRSRKAAAYRALNAIDDSLGTAATVQQMVYGNTGARSGAGVGFTRNPATGEPARYVDFLFNAQGEDVVSGRRSGDGDRVLGDVLPDVQRELDAAAALLERDLGDMQEFEFTVQDGRLFLLQTRNGKRTPLAAARIAVDMVNEGLLTREAALDRLHGVDLGRVARDRRISDADEVLAHGIPAGPGIASGPIALDPQAALRYARSGTPPILVRETPSTEDIQGLASAAGLLTLDGARTAHAAVVARQLGKACVLSCRELAIDAPSARCTIGGTPFAQGDTITVDGDRGEVLRGTTKVVVEPARELLDAIDAWRHP
jgi:pyruvate,orthophosphate dikinase